MADGYEQTCFKGEIEGKLLYIKTLIQEINNYLYYSF
jgi:hypothetical protein